MLTGFSFKKSWLLTAMAHKLWRKTLAYIHCFAMPLPLLCTVGKIPRFQRAQRTFLAFLNAVHDLFYALLLINAFLTPYCNLLFDNHFWDNFAYCVLPKTH